MRRIRFFRNCFCSDFIWKFISKKEAKHGSHKQIWILLGESFPYVVSDLP